MEPDPRFFFSDPKETVCALELRQEQRRLKHPCEKRDPLISGEKVEGTKLRALKPISRTSHKFAPNSASSHLQVTTHFHHVSPLSLRSRASPLSNEARLASLAPEPRLASLAPEPRLASLAPGCGVASRPRLVSRFSLRNRVSLFLLRSVASLPSPRLVPEPRRA